MKRSIAVLLLAMALTGSSLTAGAGTTLLADLLFDGFLLRRKRRLIQKQS
ncbi:MAG: hypothetical protein IJK28_07220 [Clostridia bacterium]|nr:hypothetical protein [Clostridia bacterium]